MKPIKQIKQKKAELGGNWNDDFKSYNHDYGSNSKICEPF